MRYYYYIKDDGIKFSVPEGALYSDVERSVRSGHVDVAMLDALPLGPWPERLQDYRSTPIEQLPVDMSEDDVGLIADFQYRDRITGLLQRFVWQRYDLHPHYPELRRFLDFWRRSLDGPLHSVRVAHARLIKPAEWRNVNEEFLLN